MPKMPYTKLSPLPENDNTLITRSELPNYIPIAVQTWAKWAVVGTGPRMQKLGSKVAYRVGDIRLWLDDQRRNNTVSS